MRPTVLSADYEAASLLVYYHLGRRCRANDLRPDRWQMLEH